jgi:hypothetical protein
MSDSFCVFILSHGRPDRVHTYKTIRKIGYTGDIRILVDDQDKTLPEYIERYGDEVVVFCKQESADETDAGDNFKEMRSVVYARNANFKIAKNLGYRYFLQLDDDYTSFYYRYGKDKQFGRFPLRGTGDALFNAFIDFLKNTPATCVAMSQGGDHYGPGNLRFLRKAMNSFFCDVERPFKFVAKMNDDVSTYLVLGKQGRLFFTAMQVQLDQLQTQSNSGGLTDIYLAMGTYVKSFYSVMYTPSCVKISTLQNMNPKQEAHPRIHHKINWSAAVPKILRPSWRK